MVQELDHTEIWWVFWFYLALRTNKCQHSI